MGREEASRRRVACLSDARGHEMKWLGRGWARQGTRTSSSDSTAGSELHGCLPVRQVSAYKTPESPGQAAASLVVGPLEVLGGPHHSPPCLEGSRDSPRCLGRERWRDGGIKVVCRSLRSHGECGLTVQAPLMRCLHVPGIMPPPSLTPKSRDHSLHCTDNSTLLRPLKTSL